MVLSHNGNSCGLIRYGIISTGFVNCLNGPCVNERILFTVIVDNRPHNEIQGQILEVVSYENNLHEQNVQHPDNDHESEVIKRSPTSTSSLVESESEEGYDRHNGNVFLTMKSLLMLP